MKMNSPGAKFKKMLAVCLAAVLLFAAGSIAVYKQSASHSTEVLSKTGSRGGTLTKDAVKKFQKSAGLAADGIAGPKTLSALGIGSASSGQYSSSDIYLLAKVIAAEARGEPYIGQVAVGAVVLNRVQHASFPDSIAGVVYQPGAFSCVNDSNWSTEPTAQSRKAAQDAINGWDPSGGAIYYYNPAKTSNKWIRTRPVIQTIGAHVFCK